MAKAEGKEKRGCLRTVFRWVQLLALAVFLVLLGVFCITFRTALYHRFYLFPKQAQAWQAIRAGRAPVTLDDGWQEFRGSCHDHSEISHDSEVTFPEIAAAANKAGIDFIFMSDHCVDGKADFSKGWKGVHDGILFVRGYEMSHGFMVWNLPDDTVLDAGKDPRLLAQEIAQKGGVLFFAHTEEERLWDLPELVGMEIYNIHTDSKDESLTALAPDLVLSLRSYPDQTIRLIFDRQTQILHRWDELNRTRKIVGIAANDAHQNTGYRGYYTAGDTLLLRSTAPHEDIGQWKLNFLTRLLLRACFGRLEPGKQLFRVDLDPYERSLRFVNTHLLAKECTQEALVDALVCCRAFVAFDMIADARGFVYLAESPTHKAVTGESIRFEKGLKLRAASPHVCRFTLIHDGNSADQKVGNTYEYDVLSPGKYRIEAELLVLDEWTPWVYTNPIEVSQEQ